MNNKRNTGHRGELLSAAFLKRRGMEILCMNFRCRYGEIDIVGKDKGYLVFVEVKARKTTNCGYPGEALTILKRKRICQAARFYCFKNRILPDQPVRYDVVEILGNRIRHVKDAFCDQ